MICFFTSSAVLRSDPTALDPSNQLIDKLKMHVKKNCRVLFICSDPDGHEKTDRYAKAMKTALERAGFMAFAYVLFGPWTEETKSRQKHL